MSEGTTQATDYTIEVVKGRNIPITEYRPGFNWTCNVCGWRGVDCFGERFAIREATEHVEKMHPEIAAPTMAPVAR